MAYYDGSFTTAVQTGPRRPSYPFGNTAVPDVYPVVYDREMMVLPTNYSPAQATRTTPKNWILQSETFGTTWTVPGSDAVIVSNTAANPNDGQLTADSLNELATTALHYVTQAFTYTAVAYTFSVCIKPNGRTWCALEMGDGTANRNCYFNLSTGAVGTATNGAVGSTVSLGNGWYRCIITATCAAGAGSARVYGATADSTPTYLGVVSTGLYLYAAQLETASSAGAYIATTTVARTGSAPTWEYSEATEGSDIFAFLVNESDPSIDFMMGRFSRRYARVPGPQVRPSSKYFDRPVMHDIKSGTSYAVSFDDGVTSTLWSSRTAATIGTMEPALNSSAIIPSTPGSLGAVQISVTLNNSTQTFNANDNDATIWAALSSAVSGNPATYASNTYFPILRNAGTMVIGNATVSCTLKALSSSDPLTEVAVGSGRLLGTGAAGIDLLEIRAVVANGDSVRRITTALAAAAGSWMAVWNGDKLAAIGKVVATDGATYSDLKLSDIPGKDFAVTHAALASAGTRYVNGPKVCTVRYTTNHYLPGVTAGITTYADIPAQTIYTDPIAWLGRIIAVPTGYAAIEVSDVVSWRGPILMQEIAEIQMDDAIDTTTAAG